MTIGPVAEQTTFVGGHEDDERLAVLVGPEGAFEIEHIEIDGVPVRSFVRAPRTLVDLFGIAAAHDDKTYLVFEDTRLTYSELRSQAGSLARSLRELYGVGRGDRVVVAMRNLPEFVVTMWASALLGAVFVPLNAWWRGSELVRALDECEPRVVVADNERVQRIRETGNVRTPIVEVRGPGADSGGGTLFGDLTRTAPLPAAEYAESNPDDVFAILFTSGTTGRPKGVVTTHRGTITNTWNMMFMAVREMILNGRTPGGTGAQNAGILTTPLFHIGGLAAVLGAAVTGSKTVLMRKWDVEEAMRIVEDEQITGMGGVPTIAREILEHPRIRAFADRVSTFSMGGANVPAELPRLVVDALGETTQLFNGYGATETTSSVTANVGTDYLENLDSVGRLNMTAELRVEASGGELVGVGELGQLCIRSPQTARGYWNNPEATAESFVDGWFRTGDLGYIDDDGFVYVVDRVKDVIIRGGENIYCAELESVLYEHPSVLDVAAVGIVDPTMGERVCVVIVPRPGARPQLADVRAFAAERLATFKCPEAMYVADDVPRSATGKVAKKQLKDVVASNPDAVERLRVS
ncbi:class I adenylate-forming enzyme family protein [Gordonia sp. LSe1-13]|uniref:Class I adenylate-forming enzyme family protein n=1 Tax=Gordonia sesuvii TaxID=3116777 RepID=A0ABU7M988_9ACTN|nr:class I adenylate-forming enzyme family protein [Gordonia sp. LSe1-13]